MPTIKAHEHSYLDAVVAGIGAVTTVSDGPDNGGNDQLACAFWKSMRHSTTKQAVTNFLSRISGNLAEVSDSDEEILRKGVGQLNICGHGYDGSITTGCGQTGHQSPSNYMATWNEYAWGAELARLKGKSFTILTFWTCHTGAGEEGADFLYAVAKHIGLPARGNTGFLYSNSKCRVWMQKGAQWQVATPDHRPTAIPSPTPHVLLVRDKAVAFEGDEMIDPRNSIKLTLSRSDITDPRSYVEVDVPEQAQRQIISELASSVEIELPGQHLGYFSHIITITQASGAQLQFGIVNRRMILDRDEQRGILVPPSLKMFLN